MEILTKIMLDNVILVWYSIFQEIKMKKIAFFICFGSLVLGIYGQTNVTNNNTITINGNVYYFRPASTPSSPPPTTGGSDFIGDGSWYGEDAAKAWASIADWAIEKCYYADSPIRGNSNERVYIHQVHAVMLTLNLEFLS